MKTSIRQLKMMINEALHDKDGVTWGTYEDLDRAISHMDPDTVAEKDYVDSDTGEIYLEKGQQAKKSRLHPDWVRTSKLRSWEAEGPDEDDDDEAIEFDPRETAQREFDAAVKSFAESCKDYDAKDEYEVEQIVPDLAESFFVQNPLWRSWCRWLDMNRADMKSYVADMAHEAMIS